MSFPLNPVNGQQATVDNVLYTYATPPGVWNVGSVNTSNISGAALTVTGNATVGNISGAALTVTGNATVGNISASSNVSSINLIGTSSLISPSIQLNRNVGPATGIQWYSPSYFAWTEYMSPAATANCGPSGSITAPSGTLVTSWAKRSYIESSAGYGWTFESGTANQITPTVVAEIRSSDGAARFSGTTTSAGSNPLATNTYDLGTAALRWRNIYTNDLQLSNGIGDYTVVEGEEDLFLYNNKSGKTFKFALIEVDPSTVPPKAQTE